MSGYPDAPAHDWKRPPVLTDAVRHLIGAFADANPDAFALAAHNPLRALTVIPGLAVIADPTARTATCPIDGTYEAKTATIRYRAFYNARDHFTLLHELAHHLLAQDERWCFEVQPALGVEGAAVEELLCSTFASRILIPDDAAQTAFTRGVTAQAIRDLAATCNASATACLVRALEEPGHRLVMLTDRAGNIWFVQGSGEPFAPSRRTPQPAIVDLLARAEDHPEQHASREGGVGIVYGTGNTNPHVAVNVAIDGGFVFAVIEPTGQDARLDSRTAEWHLTCLNGCGHMFAPNESPRTCTTCREPVCPRCHGCECRQDILCERCFITLPSQRAKDGNTLCEECE
jgi:hypothetical protein